MKKELFTLLLLALMGVCLGAQAQTAAKAKAVLDKAATKVSRAGGASASFTISSAFGFAGKVQWNSSYQRTEVQGNNPQSNGLV